VAYRFERVQPETSGRSASGRQTRVRKKSDTVTQQRAAEERVANALGSRFAWFLAPVRINAIAEDLRAVERVRDLDLGIVVIAVILSAFSRSTDTEGRVRDAFAVYRQIHTSIDVVDEAFRKAMGRSADVLLHLLGQWMGELTKADAWAPLRGRLAFFNDLRMTDSTSFKLTRALVAALPGSGSVAALKLHAVYSVRAQAAVSVEATAGREHDSPHFHPAWIAGALYLWDLGYNDYLRVLAAHLAGAYLVQRLKDKANLRTLAWYDAQGRRHTVARGSRGALPKLNDVLAMTSALHDGATMDLDVVIEGEGVEGVLRVVCVPAEGQDRYYLTNLPREHFSRCDIAELYAARWEVELLFKDWQGGCRIDEVARLSNLNTLRAVIYGGLLAHLLSREVARAANPPEEPPNEPAEGDGETSGMLLAAEPEGEDEEAQDVSDAVALESTDDDRASPSATSTPVVGAVPP